MPLRTIDCLELSHCNYRKAFQLLNDRFENRALIVQSHIGEIFQIRRVRVTDADSFRGLVDSVNSHLTELRFLRTDSEILNVVIFYLARSKLDEKSLKRWG